MNSNRCQKFPSCPRLSHLTTSHLDKKKEYPKSGLQILFVTTKNIDKMDPDLVLPEKIMAFLEHVANPLDYGYQEVHAEVILDGIAFSAVGQEPSSCVLQYRINPEIFNYECIELVDIPLTHPEIARKFLLKAATTPATYHIPIRDFILPKFVLDYLDPDLDFSLPSSWSHLYCSQFVLLFLRFCAAQNIIPIDSEKLRRKLYSVNSHACSPAHLAHILNDILKED
jgi:hypothetical protein